MKSSLFASSLSLGALALAVAACSSNSGSTSPTAAAPASTSAPTPIAASPTMMGQFPSVASAANPATSDAAPTPVTASPPPTATAGTIDFDMKVKPFFANYCLQCHGPKRQSNRVRFDTQLGLKAQLTPGNPASSRMYRAMTSNMPPEGMDKPTADEIAMIKQWITEGANISDSYPMGTHPAAPIPRPVQQQQ